MTFLPPALLHRLDVPGPRYACYPTADRFVEAFGADDYALALSQRRGGPAARALPLSLYVHIPFCESSCHYCGCTKLVTRHHERGTAYLHDLAREIGLQAAQLQRREPVAQLHLGGGTPTFLSDTELGALMALLRHHFTLLPGGDYSIGVDPRTVDRRRLAFLAGAGFNRLGFGVQDADPRVQQAIHRPQPQAQVAALVEQARAAGFAVVDVDLLYGLPLQSPASFERTLAQLLALRPDRISLHAYGHRPERVKSQRRIAAAELPPVEARLEMLTHALAALAGAGYEHIGLDQFALAGDPLALARRQGRLHRNFQGYSTQPEGDLIGLGLSAIGRIGAVYGQNARSLEEYHDHLERGRLPVTRGLALGRDDLARRGVIMALMCHGQLLFESIELAWLLDFRSHFAAELRQLELLAAEGLVRLDDAGIEVTAIGRHLIRSVVRVFDRYLQADLARERFSGII
ncbi:oxygen-independent coproporphyrinogen III oxidase [Caenimonas terrae]|uniref:Coproporphyrinogen-III oxidase n=1 Tax=Caenimonas terrae TaxID=696074 RepID=A0ABW0NKF3_9BURK